MNDSNEVSREELLQAFYKSTSKKEILENFNIELTQIKGSKIERYTQLLEQILKYSHAIIFGHKVRTATEWKKDFLEMAEQNKKLNLDKKDIDKAFSFIRSTYKREIKRMATAEPKPPKPTKTIESSDCVARIEIERLKTQLDNRTYKLTRSQKEEDKRTYIKIAIVALATGENLPSITETLKVTQEKGNIYFSDGVEKIKGAILWHQEEKDEAKNLDKARATVQGYLRDIKNHYKEKIEKKSNIGSGIRKGIVALDIKREPRKGKATDATIEICKNFYDLNALYRECLTSSTPN